MVILDGKKLAEKNQNELRDILSTQPEKNLTVILVGEDKASQTYVRNKEKACERVGIKTTTIRIPEGTLESDIIITIKKLNEDTTISKSRSPLALLRTKRPSPW